MRWITVPPGNEPREEPVCISKQQEMNAQESSRQSALIPRLARPVPCPSTAAVAAAAAAAACSEIDSRCLMERDVTVKASQTNGGPQHHDDDGDGRKALGWTLLKTRALSGRGPPEEQTEVMKIEPSKEESRRASPD
jgi:hypothetical protein